MSTVLHVGVVDASPPPGGTERAPLQIGFSQVLLALAAILSWLLLYLLVLSGLEQGHAQSALYERLRTELALGTAPTGAPIAAGAPVAVLSIPGAGSEDTVVVEGSRAVQLQDGPGHVLGSVLPGQAGVSVIAGRSLTFGGPFGQISQLPVGAPITVTTGQGTFVYEVSGARLRGDPVPTPPGDGESRLTLVTAIRGAGLGGLQAGETVYVDADLSGEAVAPGPVATADVGNRLMSSGVDTTTLALLALGLQLLLGSLAGFVWAWNRWSRAAAWFAGAPSVLAARWRVSATRSRLVAARL